MEYGTEGVGALRKVGRVDTVSPSGEPRMIRRDSLPEPFGLTGHLPFGETEGIRSPQGVPFSP
jgi:hypothetical protein